GGESSGGESSGAGGAASAAGDVAVWVAASRRGRHASILGDVLGGLTGWKTTPATRAPAPAGPSNAGPSTTAPPEVPSSPEPMAETIAVVDAVSAAAAMVCQGLTQPLWRSGDVGLSEALGELGRLRAVVDRLEVALVAEAVDRGLPRDEGLSPVDWVVAAEGTHAPKADPRRISTVIAVANACGSSATDARVTGSSGTALGVAGGVMPGADIFTEAFTTGVMPLDKAAMIARFTTDTKAVADPDAIGTDVALLVAAASDDHTGRALTTSELRRAIGLATRLLTPSRDLERDEERQRLARSLTKTHGPTALAGAAGLSTYRLVLDAEGASIIDTAVQALSAPVPDADPDGTPRLDPRPAATRRADALLTLIGRGVSAAAAIAAAIAGPTDRTGPTNTTLTDATTTDTVGPSGNPGTTGVPAIGDRAQVVVTIPFDQLVEQLAGSFGSAGTCGPTRSGGAGLTVSGELLSPAVVRRMACDARIIPVVLGGSGEILDLGRGRRLFSPAQRLAIWRRDHHCTYPACTIPAAWSDLHHLTWWSRGGLTDLTNAALLCQRHHTIVHNRDLTATVDTHGVTWHL
ncbi:MAG: DUF222 domain-containing protein, partial [Lapillicoccus sp.]